MKKLLLVLAVACAAGAAGAKPLVIYFRWGGTTEKMAQMIAASTSADIWRIEPTEAYPAEYKPCTEVVKDELEKGIVRMVKGPVPDFAGYDTIFVGVPVWWHTAPTLVTGFLEGRSGELGAKTVVPFCTYEATYRDETLARLATATPTARHLEGYCTRRPRQKEIDAWLQKIRGGVPEQPPAILRKTP